MNADFRFQILLKIPPIMTSKHLKNIISKLSTVQSNTKIRLPVIGVT